MEDITNLCGHYKTSSAYFLGAKAIPERDECNMWWQWPWRGIYIQLNSSIHSFSKSLLNAYWAQVDTMVKKMTKVFSTSGLLTFWWLFVGVVLHWRMLYLSDARSIPALQVVTTNNVSKRGLMSLGSTAHPSWQSWSQRHCPCPARRRDWC